MRFAIPPSVLAPVSLAIGVLALVWAALAYRSQRRFLGRSLKATAIVQSVRAEVMDRRTTYYFPIFRFTTAAGADVTTESKTTQAGVRVGQQIAVLYDLNNPKNVEIDSFWSHWTVVFIALSFAVLALLSAAGALVAIYASSGGSLHG